jgi:histidyl-tRNA synthetase
MSEECFSFGMATATKLREAGISTMIYPDAAKLKKQLDYANALKIDYAIIIGETELATKNLSLKNLETGEQTNHGIENLVGKLAN